MIGGLAERRSQWLQALMLSLALHGGAAAAILDVIPGLPPRTEDTAPVQLEIAALEVENGSMGPATLIPARPVPPAGGQLVTPDVTAAKVAPVLPVAHQILSPAEDLQSVTALVPLAPPGVAAPSLTGVDLAALAQSSGAVTRGNGPGVVGGGSSAAADVGLASLIRSIRAQLAQPCLLALPQANGEDLRVTLLGADPNRFGALVDALDPPQGIALGQSPRLVDVRQCPAVNFARAYRSYPVYSLRIGLDSAAITSGEALRGTISGVQAGETLTLLLIDDNGVVQDLTRFFGAGTRTAIAFDVPVRLPGDPRETAKLLVALTSPAPLDTVATRDGQLAEDFFPALAAEVVDPGALNIGLAAFDLR